jgi:hypothetical protein
VTRSNSRTSSSPLSDDVLKARDIYKSLEEDPSFNLTKAHAKYLELFGVSHADESIDEEYIALVRQHFGYSRMFSRTNAEVALPLRIALAFYLRRRRGRKHKTSVMVRHAKIAQMEEAQRLKTKYMKEMHLSAARAELRAAEELLQTFEWRGERHSFMTVDQMLDAFRHPNRLRSGRRPRR